MTMKKYNEQPHHSLAGYNDY